MRVRIKFTKNGPLKFIGHLDVMRYFQKAVRRADLPASLSEGFSPHLIMSFASPLGVGKTSSGEYFDLDLKEDVSTSAIRERLNAQMAEGIEVLSCVKIPENKANKCMTLVAAADYTISFRKGAVALPEDWEEKLHAFMDQSQIVVMRKTKRSEAETDILPWIYKMRALSLDDQTIANHPSGCEAERAAVRMTLSAGSLNNLRPDLVTQAFASFAGFELSDYAMLIHRNDLLADIGTNGARKLVSLDTLGEQVELG